MAGSSPAWTLRRLLALWRFYGAMDLKWMMRDARSLLLWTLSDVITAISAVASTLLLAARFNGIGRWSTPQITFMLGYALLVGMIPNIFFNYNVAYISRRIGRGQFDHVLVQPQPLWMILLTEGFSPFTTMLGLLPALALLAWPLGRGVHTVTIGWLAAFGLNVVASVAIALSFSLIVGSLAFWAPRRGVNQQQLVALAGVAQTVPARRHGGRLDRHAAHGGPGRLPGLVSQPRAAGHRRRRLCYPGDAAGRGCRGVAGNLGFPQGVTAVWPHGIAALSLVRTPSLSCPAYTRSTASGSARPT